MTIYILIKKFLFHCNVPFLVDFSWDMSSINVFISAYSGNRQRVGWYTTAERIGPVLFAFTFLHISLHQITMHFQEERRIHELVTNQQGGGLLIIKPLVNLGNEGPTQAYVVRISLNILFRLPQNLLTHLIFCAYCAWL